MVRPRHVVCVLGDWTDLAPVRAAAVARGASFDDESSTLAPDPRMARAFAASADRVVRSLTDEDEAAIEGHRAVAYVLSPHLEPETAPALAATMLDLIVALFDLGGVAAKGESSGIAHGAARWRELAAQARATDPFERAAALHGAWVRRPLADDESLYTCGMHLLGERDVEIAASGDVIDDLAWLDAVAGYLVAEKPARGVRDGEGFRRVADGPRRLLQARPCRRYDEDDFFFNPYGYWRLTDPTGA